MTDARMPSRWLYDPDLDALSDRAWRTFVGSLMWCNEQGTDGLIPFASLRFLHPDGIDDKSITELTSGAHWLATAAGYQVVDWAKTQSLAADVEHQRDRNRRNVQALRERERQARSSSSTVDEGQPVSGDVIDYESDDVHGDVSAHVVGQDRTGALKVTTLEVANRDCVHCGRARLWPSSSPCPFHQAEAS